MFVNYNVYFRLNLGEFNYVFKKRMAEHAVRTGCEVY